MQLVSVMQFECLISFCLLRFSKDISVHFHTGASSHSCWLTFQPTCSPFSSFSTETIQVLIAKPIEWNFISQLCWVKMIILFYRLHHVRKLYHTQLTFPSHRNLCRMSKIKVAFHGSWWQVTWTQQCVASPNHSPERYEFSWLIIKCLLVIIFKMQFTSVLWTLGTEFRVYKFIVTDIWG